MDAGDLLDRVLFRDEGREHVAYPDPLTKAEPWTIGVGHTGPEVHEGLVWDDAQIDFAYQLDKAAAWQACLDHFQPWFLQLTTARQVVLASMMFQMGPTRTLKFVGVIGNARDGHYANAAEHMRQSVWGTQTPKRVNRLATMMDTGVPE